MLDFPLEENILTVVRRRQRDVRVGVLPKTVQAGLPVSIAEQTCRAYMARMWRDGRLFRFGGTNARRGYRALKESEIVIEKQIVSLLERNPWGLVADKIAEMLSVRVEIVEGYLPQLEYRGVILFNRGAWRLPSELQKLSYVLCGQFGYRVA